MALFRGLDLVYWLLTGRRAFLEGVLFPTKILSVDCQQYLRFSGSSQKDSIINSSETFNYLFSGATVDSDDFCIFRAQDCYFRGVFGQPATAFDLGFLANSQIIPFMFGFYYFSQCFKQSIKSSIPYSIVAGLSLSYQLVNCSLQVQQSSNSSWGTWQIASRMELKGKRKNKTDSMTETSRETQDTLPKSVSLAGSKLYQVRLPRLMTQGPKEISACIASPSREELGVGLLERQSRLYFSAQYMQKKPRVAKRTMEGCMVTQKHVKQNIFTKQTQATPTSQTFYQQTEFSYFWVRVSLESELAHQYRVFSSTRPVDSSRGILRRLSLGGEAAGRWSDPGRIRRRPGRSLSICFFRCRCW